MPRENDVFFSDISTCAYINSELQDHALDTVSLRFGSNILHLVIRLQKIVFFEPKGMHVKTLTGVT